MNGLKEEGLTNKRKEGSWKKKRKKKKKREGRHSPEFEHHILPLSRPVP